MSGKDLKIGVSALLRWRVLLLLVCLMVLATAVAGTAKSVSIGISQIAEHPALDAARQGFVDRMEELGYKEGQQVVYDVRNAQGDMATAQTIARKFAADGVDLILAIATPTAQAAANVTNKIPILITAVTDPEAAGLVKSNEKPETNVTGTSDLNPVAEQIALVKTLKPQARRLGVVYNAGETNSVVQVDLARQAVRNEGMTLVEATASNTSEVLQAAQSLVGRVDAIYVPTDNTVVSALESVIMVTERAKIPLISGEADSVRRGAIATLGIDYYRLGQQTADMAVQVLKGSDPAAMPIQYQRELRLVVNVQAAERMGVKIPQSMMDKADEIVR